MLIGILSDTHGLLRPTVLEALRGCDHLLHAGDVGDRDILRQLEDLAPLTAIGGNTDVGTDLAFLPTMTSGDLGGLRFHMVHRREDIPAAWSPTSSLIVFGHSHRPELEWHGRCLWLNPGACGRRRFHLPLTIAKVRILEGQRLIPEIHSVEDP